MSKISAKHYVMFILGVTIISLKTYSSLFINLGGRDSWICTILAFILLFIYALILINIADKREVYDISEIFTMGLSKIVGNIFLFLFAVGLFLTSIEAVSVEANCIKTNFFLDTPEWYIILFFILPSLFLLGKNSKTITIFVIITTAALVANSIILSIITEKYQKITYLLPVMSNGLSKEFFQCILLILGSISTFAITLPFMKYLIKDSKLKLHSIIILSILALFSIYSIISSISIFGPLRAANLFYPEFTQSQRVEIGSFVEFGELFFLFQTVLGLFIKYLLCSYGIYLIYKKYIPNHKVYITVYSIAAFVLGTLLARNNYRLFDILKYYNYGNLFFFILIPLIAYSCFAFRKTPKTFKK